MTLKCSVEAENPELVNEESISSVRTKHRELHWSGLPLAYMLFNAILVFISLYVYGKH